MAQDQRYMLEGCLVYEAFQSAQEGLHGQSATRAGGLASACCHVPQTASGVIHGPYFLFPSTSSCPLPVHCLGPTCNTHGRVRKRDLLTLRNFPLTKITDFVG